MMHMLAFFWMGLVNNVYSRPEAFQKNEASPVQEPLVADQIQSMAA